MQTSPSSASASYPQRVLEALRSAEKPLDAYELARCTGLSAMEAGRTLEKLVRKGKACWAEDPEENAINPLATRARLAS